MSSDAPPAQILATVSNILREAPEEKPPPANASSSTQDPQGYAPSFPSQGELKGFYSSAFVKPKDFTRKSRESASPRFKRPLLGPDARESRKTDLFYQLDIDPLAECENSALLSEFVTEMGRIKSRNQTKLTWRNQRRVGKAIRRAKMMGIIPMLSRRPLVSNLYE